MLVNYNFIYFVELSMVCAQTQEHIVRILMSL